jgi:hypothetical protein
VGAIAVRGISRKGYLIGKSVAAGLLEEMGLSRSHGYGWRAPGAGVGWCRVSSYFY